MSVAAARLGVAIEIDDDPARQDLDRALSHCAPRGRLRGRTPR